MGASPTRRPLQPEATGVGMEETTCLKPSDWRIGWIAGKAHRCGMRGQDRAAFSFEDREATRHASVHLAQLCRGGRRRVGAGRQAATASRIAPPSDWRRARTASSIPQAQPVPTSSPSDFVVTAPMQQDPERRGEGAALKIGRQSGTNKLDASERNRTACPNVTSSVCISTR